MKFDMKMILEYPKVFEENYDKGDPDAPVKSAQGTVAKKGGQTVVNAYFNSEEDKEKLIKAGLDLKPMGHDRIKKGNQEFGIGEYIKLSRGYKDNVKTFENKKGGTTEINYGGLPKVLDYRDPENKKLWSVAEDGFLGNGTEAIVRFDMYSEGAGLRLEALAITNLVEYEQAENQQKSEYADVWDS